MINELKSSIFTVIAMPKQFLWAPFEIAIINIILAIAVMLIAIAVLGVTPFISVIPLIVGHAALIGLGARNPHLTTTLQASGKYPQRRRNLARVGVGVKYVP